MEEFMRRTSHWIAATMLLAACNEASFTQPGKRLAAEEPDVKVERFPLASKTSRIVDMIWIIDNSGSMTDEIELVRQNFGSFVAGIAEFSDLNLGLVTAATAQDRRRGIDLHFLAPNIRSQQFTYNVGSTNLLSLLAAGICDSNSTEITNSSSLSSEGTICGTPVSEWMESSTTIHAIRGQLKSFFRENSKKVFVVVTDDDAIGIDNTNFLNILNAQMPQQEIYLFGFVGLTENGAITNPNPTPGVRTCSVANVGKAYLDLATRTNGKSFDICQDNWSGHFSELTKNVENIVNTEFTLNTSKSFNLIEILVDGKLLPEHTFNIQNNRIVILDRSLVQGAQTLEVKYTVAKDIKT
jgi:hypothetical protein